MTAPDAGDNYSLQPSSFVGEMLHFWGGAMDGIQVGYGGQLHGLG